MKDGVVSSSRLLLVGTTDWIGQLAETVRQRTDAQVRRAETAAAAREYLESKRLDCLVTEYHLPESTGVTVLEEIRDLSSTLPVIVGTARGSEAIASEAVGAGASDYVAVDGWTPSMESELLERIERAIRTGARTETRRERARQFDAIFRDARVATWILDPSGAVRRANETARGMLDEDIGSVGGRPFWSISWWSQAPETQSDVRRIVEKAIGGTFGSATIFQSPLGKQSQVVELSVRPVENERDELMSIVVEAVDVSDRVDLERDLRQSERLHRVTLNNMTDTVLITDEAGEYTYVCPNVHFIFGYSADEIREQGSIYDLLGDDLFDREELAREGVLKNIECTATDKAGREHTLLVNVREVSIQDGRFLFSCRDITKRKRRDEALATLQEMAREFLYAETHQEIAHQVVEDTGGVLDLDASAVYLFDETDNDLRPAAYTSQMEALNGPLPTVHADSDTLHGYSFVEDEPLFFEDVRTAERHDDLATDIRSVIYMPLGDHGLLVAGTDSVGAFDEVTRELADLLAATAEAALDRVTRESQLREQERTLQQRNAQLTSVNRINETIREIDQALVRAEMREEIDHTVCELLTRDDRFSFAWLGVVDPSGETVEPLAWAGDDQGYLDSLEVSVAQSRTEPAGRTAATQEVTMITNVPARLREESWRKVALSRDFLSVMSIPLMYNDLTYGVLTVYDDNQDAFDETSKAVLSELGETIAAAISAIERRNALLTTSMTRLEFTISDPSFVLSRLAEATGGTLTYQGGTQQTADGAYVFVTVEDAPIEDVESAAADLVSVRDVHRISTDGPGGVLRLQLTGSFLALELANHGAVFRRATADPNATTLEIDVPETVGVRQITDLVRDSFAGVELRSKQTVDQATEYSLSSQFLDKITDRQLEVVQTAYYSGFFDSPRDATGEEVADTLDISSTAFYQHVRTVQGKLFAALFDDIGVPVTTPIATDEVG